MSDETIFDQGQVNNEPQKNEAIQHEEKKAPSKEQAPVEAKPSVQRRKGMGAGGVLGVATVSVMAGAAVGFLTPVDLYSGVSNLFGDSVEDLWPGDDEGGDEDLELVEPPTPDENLVGNDMDVATDVNDSMSFNEAFAAARQEVGAGGLFVWHGHTYGTYYANEWNAMSAEEKDQYWADVYHTTSNIEYHPETELESDPIANNNLEPELDVETGPEHETDQESDSEPEPQTLDLHEDEVFAELDLNDDGAPDVAIVDANGNGMPDVVLDTTGDGQYDTLILDPEVDDNSGIVINEDNVQDIDGLNVMPSEEPELSLEDSVLAFNESEVYAAIDANEDGQIDTMIVDADGNEALDLVLDTTGDGNMDTLIIDPSLDDEGNLVLDEAMWLTSVA